MLAIELATDHMASTPNMSDESNGALLLLLLFPHDISTCDGSIFILTLPDTIY
jgi:hypothetical protein